MQIWVRAGTYKLGVTAGKYKLGARAGGQAKGGVPGNTKSFICSDIRILTR